MTPQAPAAARSARARPAHAGVRPAGDPELERTSVDMGNSAERERGDRIHESSAMAGMECSACAGRMETAGSGAGVVGGDSGFRSRPWDECQVTCAKVKSANREAEGRPTTHDPRTLTHGGLSDTVRPSGAESLYFAAQKHATSLAKSIERRVVTSRAGGGPANRAVVT